MNNFLPLLIALLIHALPLGYLLFKEKTVEPTASTTGRPQGIDLAGFRAYKNSGKASPHKALPHTEKSAVSVSSEAATGSTATQASSSSSSSSSLPTTNASSVILSATEPVYPPLARQKGLEGLVKLRAHYNSEGVITQVEVIESSGTKMLDESAKKALGAWKIKPGAGGSFEKIFQFKLRN